MRNTWLLIAAILLSHNLAQSQNLIFEKISKGEGLSQASGKAFAQDNLGYIWIGTFDGLNRFDGKTFDHYYHEWGNDSSIPNNTINDLLIDSLGYIWVGTNEGLCRYSPKTDDFESSGLSRGIKAIRKLYLDSKGNLWVITTKQILLLKDLSTIASSIDIVATEIIDAGDNKYWIGTSEGLFSYDIKSGISTSLLTDHRIHDFEYQDSILWIGTDKGLFTTNNFNNELSKTTSFIGKNCRSLKLDNDNQLWVAADNVYLFDIKNSKLKTVSNIDASPYGISNSNVLALFRDRDGGMWLGTDGFGVNYYNPIKIYLTHLNHSQHNNNSLPSPFVTSILENRDGNIYIGTLNGLSIFNPHTQKFNNYSESDGLTGNAIRSITNWNGQVLVGTGKGVCLQTKNGFRQVFPSLEKAKIRTFLVDSSRLWIGAVDGLFVVDGIDSAPIKIDSIDNEVVSLKYDKEGTLWCGTEQGLVKIKGDSVINIYTSEPKNRKSLYNNFVKSIELDHTGRLWIGTKGGLSLYHPDTDDFSTITTKDGLPNNLIYGILADRRNKLWLSTNNGICLYDPDSTLFSIYTTDDNLQGNEFNSGAYHRGRSGFMYFGGINGLNIFNPKQITRKVGKPLTVITGIELFHQPLPIKAGGILQVHPSVVDSIVFNHNQNTIAFRFASINFISPNNIRYRYKLEGLDKDWVVTSVPMAQFTNLNPGTYHFTASSSNRDGEWADSANKITLIITRPLWQHLWFQIASAIFILTLVYIIYRLRIRSFKRRQLQLEMEVQVRTEEIAAQNEELQQQSDTILERNQMLNKQKQELHVLNEDLEQKVQERTISLLKANEDMKRALSELDMFIYRSSHDLRGPVATLLGLSSLMLMNTKDQDSLNALSKVVETTNTLSDTLDKLLSINVINREVIHNEQIRLKPLIDSLANHYTEKRGNNTTKINVDIPKDFILQADTELIKIIIDQLLNNSVTYTLEDKSELLIDVKSKQVNGCYELIFKDNGHGIADNIKEDVFKMFYRGSSKSKGNGLGLYVVKKAIDKLQGKIRFESSEEEGTTFYIELPCNPQ